MVIMPLGCSGSVQVMERDWLLRASTVGADRLAGTEVQDEKANRITSEYSPQFYCSLN